MNTLFDLDNPPRKSTRQIVSKLKEAGQDFEFYPTTREMIAPIFENYKIHSRSIKNFLDIGCGTCNFLTFMNELYDEDKKAYDMRQKRKEYEAKLSGERYCAEQYWLSWFDYQVMEKSKILIDQLPKDTVVLGTDFNTNTLLDKNVDAIFCNPPYSEFENWTKRIIRESNAQYIYLIIPERWKDNAEIMQAIKDTGASTNILGSFDFLHAERAARAKVDVILIDKSRCPKNQAFDNWFDATFQMRDKEIKRDYEKEREEEKKLKNQLIGGKNKVEILVNLYNEELTTLYKHFKAISSLDVDILESIGVSKTAVKESLKSRIEGLKNLYWRLVFDEMEEITSRLTAATKEKLYNRFKGLLTVDFNHENIYSLVAWVCKNASAYYDEQLIELYKTFTSPENILKYKSNQKVFKEDKWYNDKRRFDNIDEVTHYCLSYRIICDNLYFRASYSWRNEIDDHKVQTIIKDLCAVANNLGFTAKRWDNPEVFGHKYYIWMDNGKPLLEFKVYQNGNTHIKLDKEFAKALNVEVARLLGWIRDKSDIAKEFPDEMAEGAEKYYNSNFSQAIMTTKIKLLTSN